MIETTIRNPEKHETVRADSQGRVSLGVEYADHEVELVVVAAEESDSESRALQQAIGDRPLADHERTAMLFVRSFGLDRRCLAEDHGASVGEDGVEAATVGVADVDWSRGVLVDGGNVARFRFDESESAPFSDEPTNEPAAVRSVDDGEYDVPVSLFENEAGGASAIAQEFAEKIRRIYGYDPTAETEHVRVHAEEAPYPVQFCDPAGDTHVAVAPRVVD